MMEVVANAFIDKAQQQQESGAAKRVAAAAAAAAAWEPETGSILDPFHIEDLLDFSNEDIAGPIGDEVVGHQHPSPASMACSLPPPPPLTQHHHSSSIEQQPGNEFSIHCDEMPELEWLSSLVDDETFTSVGDELHKNMFIGSKGSSYASPSMINTAGAAGSGTGATPSNKRCLDNLLLLDDITAATNTKEKFQVGSPISVLESTSSATSGSRPAAAAAAAGGKDLSVPGRPRSKRPRSSSTWNTSSSSLINAGSSSNSIIGGGGGGGDTILIHTATNAINFSSSPATSSISDKDLTSSDGSVYEQDTVESVPTIVIARPELSSSATIINSSSSSSLCNTNKTSTSSIAAGKPPLSSSIASTSSGNAGGEVQPRRCTHCLSQKTPQWRAGPEGPKTLCNACGVRFKSGRLFPEYRPALSPTFLSEVHSNSHRKVLEMRRQKESHTRHPHHHHHHHHHQQQQQQQQSFSSSSSPSPSPSSSSPAGEVLDGGLIYNVVN